MLVDADSTAEEHTRRNSSGAHGSREEDVGALAIDEQMSLKRIEERRPKAY